VSVQNYTRNVIPMKGLYTSAVSDAIPPDYTPWCENVRFRFGNVQRAPGRSLPLQALPRDIMDYATLTDKIGGKSLIALTANSLTNIVAHSYDESTFRFSTTPITLAAPALWNIRPSWTQGEERLFVCRASKVAAIQPGGVVEVLTSPKGCFLEYFNNRVVLMRLIEPPFAPPPGSSVTTGMGSSRIQWSKQGVYTDWSTATDGGGFLELYDNSVEPITGGKVLGDRLTVYRKSSIVDLVPTGVSTAPFLPEKRSNGIGCAFPWTLASAGQFHIFVGNDFNVYKWDGSRLDPIGTPIHAYVRQLIDLDKDLPDTVDWKCTPFATMFMGFKEYHLAIPQKNGNVVVLVYDYLRESWTRDQIPGMTAFYEWQQKVAVDASRVYDILPYPEIFPTLVAGRSRDFFIIDERFVGDYLPVGSTGGMEMFFDSPDMFYGKEGVTNGTLQRIVISQAHPTFLTEVSYLVEVSVDRGKTFVAGLPVRPSYSRKGFEFVEFNITSNVRRYRFRYPLGSTAGKPSWRAYTDIFVPSGDFFPTEGDIDAPYGIWDETFWNLCLWG